MSDPDPNAVDPQRFSLSNHPGLYYQDMLADHVRMQRYREAIQRCVRPGDVVADLGTGLGVLALMAAQAGAARVYAVDNRPGAAFMARRVIDANRDGERVRVVEADARELQLDEPVDLIVNELIGDFGSDENIHECVRAFAQRNLKSNGRVLPSQLVTWLAPVEYAEEFRGVFRDGYYGLDLRPAVDFPCRPDPVLFPMWLEPTPLAPAQVVEDITFDANMAERTMDRTFDFPVCTAGTLQGFVGWFDATLCEGVHIATYPCYPTCHWNNWHWPVNPPLQVSPGQRLEATLHMRPDMVAAGWSLEWRLR